MTTSNVTVTNFDPEEFALLIEQRAERASERAIRKVLSELESIGKRKPLSGAKAIAEHTGLAESTVYKLTALNAIPHSKRGKKLTADPDELDAWLLANKVEPLDRPATRPDIYTRTRSRKASSN